MELLTAALAEKLVADLLQHSGWKLESKNFRVPGSEIDLIASRGETLVFVEVKLRRSPFYLVEELMNPKKKLALLRGAERFISKHHDSWGCYRFDLAVVTPIQKARSQIEYFVDVFNDGSKIKKIV